MKVLPSNEIVSTNYLEISTISQLFQITENLRADEQKTLKIKGPSLRQDIFYIFLLIYLNFLKGIPIGIASSIPKLIADHGVHFNEQGIFSLVFWPYSLKVLWGPCVDTFFIKRIGRRKSWVIPLNFITGILFISLASTVESLVKTKNSTSVFYLTIIFLVIIFLNATLDTVTSGWSLTMLAENHVRWISTCQVIGQTSGTLMGGSIFIMLASEFFSNKYIRKVLYLADQPYGILSLSSKLV